jgi:hypothetical protein
MAGKELYHIWDRQTSIYRDRKGLFSMFVILHHWRVTKLFLHTHNHYSDISRQGTSTVLHSSHLHLASTCIRITTPQPSYRLPGSPTSKHVKD